MVWWSKCSEECWFFFRRKKSKITHRWNTFYATRRIHFLGGFFFQLTLYSGNSIRQPYRFGTACKHKPKLRQIINRAFPIYLCFNLPLYSIPLYTHFCYAVESYSFIRTLFWLEQRYIFRSSFFSYFPYNFYSPYLNPHNDAL